MVYIPRISFKTGMNPSRLATFPLKGPYSGTQRLLLTRTRIFGDVIAGSMGLGTKVLRQTMPGRFMFYKNNSVQLHDVRRDIPGLYDQQFQSERFAVMKQWGQEKKLQKQAKKAAKQAKKKK